MMMTASHSLSRLTFALHTIVPVLSQRGVALVPSTGAQQSQPTAADGRRTTVLFMCPHGAAKSVLASAYFQRVAKERGLNVRVEAAGIEPQEAVSTVVAEHL